MVSARLFLGWGLLCPAYRGGCVRALGGAAVMRIIIDCNNTDDLSKCLHLAREGLRTGEEGDVWGYWSSSDPNFSALIRFNKVSISVRGRRKPPVTTSEATPHRTHSHYGQTDNIASKSVDSAGGKADQ
jgi:hypothetical protein